MFENYIKSTLRNLSKDKLYTLINIFGLAISFTCCFIIILHLRVEFFYDQQNVDHQRIYRVVGQNAANNRVLALTSRMVGPLLSQDNSEIENYVRFSPYAPQFSSGRTLFTSERGGYYWDNVYYADESVFDVFTHDTIEGDPDTALLDPFSIAVSSSFARQLFADNSAIGKAVSVNAEDYTIGLVFADQPENVHLQYDVLFSFNRLTLPSAIDPNANYFAFTDLYTYLLFDQPVDTGDFQEISDTFNNRYMRETDERVGAKVHLVVEPLNRIHLHSTALSDQPHGNIFYAYIIAAVGIFLLFVACTNYVNLATAKSIRRAREIGVRKVLGASRHQLLAQFLIESVALSWFAMLAAYGLVEFILASNLLAGFLGPQLSIMPMISPANIVLAFALCTLIGMLSGAYPAFYLSAILPVLSMKTSSSGKSNLRLREFLILLQFVVTVSVISSTLLMFQQLQYLNNKSLGFEDEAVLTVPITGANSVEKLPAFINDLTQNSAILAASTTRHYPGIRIPNHNHMVEDNEGMINRQNFSRMEVGEGLMEALGMELVLGRGFDAVLQTDMENAVILNEFAVKEMDWDDPIGKRFLFGSLQNGFDGVVIGVVKDFHFYDFHQPIGRLAIHIQGSDFSNLNDEDRSRVSRFLVLKIADESTVEVLNSLRERWNDFDSTHPFEYSFLNEFLDSQYATETRQVGLMSIFSIISIVVSCMGIFGMSSLTTQQRTKEIGIRKILGASIFRIVSLLFERTFTTILLASMIAFAISYYIINRWMDQFAYYEDVNLLIFPLSMGITVFVALVAAGYQSLKAAMMNPVQSLRYE